MVVLGHSGQGGWSALSVHTKCALGVGRRCPSKQNFGLVKWEMHTGFVYCKRLTLKLCFLQVEGKGNGIKTVIVNMVDVAKALNRPPTCK